MHTVQLESILLLLMLLLLEIIIILSPPLYLNDNLPVCFKIDLINLIPPPPSVAINWNKFCYHLSIYIIPISLFLKSIILLIDSSIIHLQIFVTSTQKQVTFHKCKNSNTFLFPNNISQYFPVTLSSHDPNKTAVKNLTAR